MTNTPHANTAPDQAQFEADMASMAATVDALGKLMTPDAAHQQLDWLITAAVTTADWSPDDHAA